jgi:hypothetical protein
MKTRIRAAILLTLVLSTPIAAGSYPNEGVVEPFKFFRQYVGLNDDQISAIQAGKAVARILDSRTPDEVFVFGAVYVHSTPEAYLKLASNVDSLRKLPSYLAIHKFSEPPQLADLDGLELEADDIRALRKCKTGDCEVQLPNDAIEEFHRSVDWSTGDAAKQVDRLAREMVLEALLRYQHGGNAALGTYRDKNHPAAVADAFQSLLNRSSALPAYLPDLDSYLLDYPNAQSENMKSDFYWEKVNFGLKPTIRVIQAIVYRGASATDPAYAVALKQLYSSHYFETALDITVCVRDDENQKHAGFYLITLKGSQQAGLTGLKGGIVRKVAVDKTRSSLEKALAAVKQKLEAPAD